MKKTTCNFRKHNSVLFLLVFFLMTIIIGCATTGPKYSTIRNDDTILPKEKGRIIFYRPDIMYGAAMTPDILLDNRKVGESHRGTVFYVDIAPGKHQVKVPNVMYPGETTIDIELHQNEILYVKTYMGGSAFGGRTNIEVVSSEQARAEEIDNLIFITQPLK